MLTINTISTYHADILLTRENANNLLPHFLLWPTTLEHTICYEKMSFRCLPMFLSGVLSVPFRRRPGMMRRRLLFRKYRFWGRVVWGATVLTRFTLGKVQRNRFAELLQNTFVIRSWKKNQHNYTYNRESWFVIIMHVGVDKNTHEHNRECILIEFKHTQRINRKPGDRLFSTQFHSL